jgi:enolase
MSRIERLAGLEILDSRGRPTVQVFCELSGGASASASVPSGASTGSAEAHELRDGDPRRYGGLGCRRAVANIHGEIHRALANRVFGSQRELDDLLVELDGTAQKSRLGANALLAVSLAFARAQAAERGVALWQHFAEMWGEPVRRLPRLTINLFSGGKHGGDQLSIQDVLIVPKAASSIDESLVVASAVYASAVRLVNRKYNMRWLTADEGGLAPPAPNTESLLADAIEAIEVAGFTPGQEVCLAVDLASSNFYRVGQYSLDGESLTAVQVVARVQAWVERYHIISVEDALAEEDWDHWPSLVAAINSRALIVGDDLLCTNPLRIQRAIDCAACNTLLLKVNQVGTLSEALDALRSARSANWKVTVSVRSGETEDNWFSDLAVGWQGDQTKAGSLTQSERLSKYNRLLAIENELKVPLVRW